MKKTWKTLVVLVCVALVSAKAWADIKAYNAAVRAGDYKTAAAEAKAIWPGWNRADRDTAVLAREFGFASYVAGDYAAARDYGRFLVDNGASLAVPDDQPATSAVLLRLSEFRMAPGDKSRWALFDALKARSVLPGFDNLTLLGAEAVYRSDWTAGEWAAAISSANFAADVISRGGPALAPKAHEARLHSAAADFLDRRDDNDYARLADVHDAIVDTLDAVPDRRNATALVNLKLQAQAWTELAAWGLGGQAQIGSNIPRGPKYRELKEPKVPLFGAPEVEDPSACRGRIEIKDFKFPKHGTRRWLTGAVLIRMSFDAHGVPITSAALASAPMPGLAAEIMAEVGKLRRVRTDVDAADCNLTRTDRVISFLF